MYAIIITQQEYGHKSSLACLDQRYHAPKFNFLAFQ